MIGPLGVKACGDPQPVDSVHPGEILGHRAGLVGLQATDEMPGEFQSGELADARQCLLQVALAKVPGAELRQRLHRGGALPLADRNKRDGVLIAATGQGRARYPGTNQRQACSQIANHR